MGSWSGAGSGALSGAASGAAAGPVGMAVGAGIGALFGGLSSPSPAQQAQTAVAKNVPNLINTGNSAVSSGLGTLGQAGRFYSSILNGNRDSISNTLGPTVGTILSQYDNAAKSVASFAPRGGGATQTMAQLPFKKATALGTVYQSVLPGAAAGAASVGSATAGVGGGLLGTANGTVQSGFPYENLEASQHAAAGKGIGQMLVNILKNKPGGGGGGFGSNSTNDSGDAF